VLWLDVITIKLSISLKIFPAGQLSKKIPDKTQETKRVKIVSKVQKVS
jgi:hypothetical protein